jgi:DnaJ-class molecular chaperone
MRRSNYVETDQGRFAPKDCPNCSGTGTVIATGATFEHEDCWTCQGTGEVADRDRPITSDLPPAPDVMPGALPGNPRWWAD